MELLRGGELYQNICGRSVLSEEEAYKIIVPLAECLSYMHSMGIIHRDIKVKLRNAVKNSLRIFYVIRIFMM